MSVKGILPVVPTPFLDGAFDAASFERMLEHSVHGVDGYTLLGSTGEAPSLTTVQRMAIAEQALALIPPEKTVVVGVSHTSVEESIRLALNAQELGAGAVLCSVPYYFQNTYEGVLRFLRRLDAELQVDLVLYDNPVATKTVLRYDWVLGWAEELEHLRSVKLTDHDPAKIGIWQGAGLGVLAGDDPVLFEFLAAGVDGAMVIAPAVLADSFRATWELAKRGDLEAALGVFARELAPFIHVFGIGEEIATTKALFADIGVFASDELLPPLTGVGPARRRQLRRAFEIGKEAAGLRAEAKAPS
jgi:4-hydroxy-tetrahydrodipicolinate synthase